MKLFDINPEILDWDSNFFGFPIYRCRIRSDFSEEHERFLSDIKAKLIYVQSHTFNNLVSSNSFSFIDRKITLKKDIKANEDFTNDNPLIEFREKIEINPEWHELIFSSGLESRFFRDDRFPSTLAQKLYIQWVQKAIDDENGYFIVVNYNKSVAGFVTFHCDGVNAKIGLIAVGKEFYRKGLGTSLLNETQKHIVRMDIKSLYITTQFSNIAAIKFYESLGFKKHIDESLGHYWLS